MNINRRNLLKRGILSMGGMAVAPYLQAGAFGNAPLNLDAKGRIYYSPMVREHFLDEMPAFNSMVRIGSNENPYGPPMSAREAIKESIDEGAGNRYSWQEMAVLVDKIAKKEGVTKDNIMMGPGSSDLLEKTALVLCQGGNVVSADPTYMSLVRVAEAVGASWKAIQTKPDWSHDLDAMEKAVDNDTKLVYICNPNNPMGSLTDVKKLVDFCSRVSEKVPVFVDEAYLEFADGATESMVKLVAQGKNVIIARTFSKAMGMAGLRIGYLVAQKSTLDTIQKITRGGMGISFTSIKAATAALSDPSFETLSIKNNKEVKDHLCKGLKELGYKYVPSYTNFVIFPIAMNGKDFLGKMAAKGVSIRSFDIQSKSWCRVSIGTMDEIKQFLTVLKTIA